MLKLLFSIVMTAFFLTLSARSEIPFTHALGVYKATKDEYKHLSPFWGMVALEMLPNLRLFGNYEVSTPLGGGYSQDQGMDAIAELIQWLFPSRDGIEFVANANRNDPVGDLSRKPGNINDIIKALLSKRTEKEKSDDIIKQLKFENTKTTRKDKDKFIKILLDAYAQQAKFANPDIPESQLYPKDIVVISLLAFFAKVSDEKANFKSLSLLMKPDFDATSKFELKDYLAIKNNISSIFQDDEDSIEKAYLMAIGYEKYENSFAKPINYQAGICFKNRAGFADCGETSLRNALMLLLPRENNSITNSLEFVAKNIKPQQDTELKNTPFQKVLEYFPKYPSLEEASQKKAHDAWAEVVSDLNLDESDAPLLENIQYGQKAKDKNVATYQIVGNFSHVGVNGIINMLNVIAKILPDQKLNQPWPRLENSNDFDETEGFKLAAEKLTRFCEILSTAGHKISWQNADTNNQTLMNYFPSITLKINELAAYSWQFMPIHFQISLIASPENDWRLAFAEVPEKTFFNEWIASLYLRLGSDSFIKNPALGSIYPRAFLFGSHANLSNPDTMIRAASFILYRNYKSVELVQFLPLIGRFIEKSNYLNHEHPLKLISELLLATSKIDQLNKFVGVWLDRFPKINEKVNEISKNADLNALASSLQKNRDMMSALIFLNADARFNELIPSSFVKDDILKNLTNLTGLNLDNNELITDEGIKNLIHLTDLSLDNNKKISDSGIENLHELTSLNLADNEKISDSGIINLTKLANLNLAYNDQISNKGIKNLTELTKLDLTNNDQISNKAFKNFNKLTNLNLAENDEISDEGLKNLANPTLLTTLNLANNDQISDEGLDSFTEITDLDLTNNEKITDKTIKKLTKLTHLNLERAQAVNDDGIKDLRLLKNLNLVSNNRITSAGIENLKQLTHLNLAYNKQINRIRHLEQLQSLDLTYNETIKNDEIEKLINLTELNLASNEKITDAGIENLTGLLSLNLDRNRKITNAGIQNLKRLTTLNLSGNRLITSVGLANLPKLVNIIRNIAK